MVLPIHLWCLVMLSHMLVCPICLSVPYASCPMVPLVSWCLLSLGASCPSVPFICLMLLISLKIVRRGLSVVPIPYYQSKIVRAGLSVVPIPYYQSKIVRPGLAVPASWFPLILGCGRSWHSQSIPSSHSLSILSIHRAPYLSIEHLIPTGILF
jgi:hypothetical protein